MFNFVVGAILFFGAFWFYRVVKNRINTVSLLRQSEAGKKIFLRFRLCFEGFAERTVHTQPNNFLILCKVRSTLRMNLIFW